MSIKSEYLIEDNLEIPHSEIMDWLLEERFYYEELKLLDALVSRKRMENNLGLQLRKDVLVNLRSMLNILLKDLQDREKYIADSKVVDDVANNIVSCEECLSKVSTTIKIKRKIKDLKRRTLTFLERTRFNDCRYRVTQSPVNEIPTKIDRTKKHQKSTRTLETNKKIKRYGYGHKTAIPIGSQSGNPAF